MYPMGRRTDRVSIGFIDEMQAHDAAMQWCAHGIVTATEATASRHVLNH